MSSSHIFQTGRVSRTTNESDISKPRSSLQGPNSSKSMQGPKTSKSSVQVPNFSFRKPSSKMIAIDEEEPESSEPTRFELINFSAIFINKKKHQY